MKVLVGREAEDGPSKPQTTENVVHSSQINQTSMHRKVSEPLKQHRQRRKNTLPITILIGNTEYGVSALPWNKWISSQWQSCTMPQNSNPHAFPGAWLTRWNYLRRFRSILYNAKERFVPAAIVRHFIHTMSLNSAFDGHELPNLVIFKAWTTSSLLLITPSGSVL